jgi:hypothetical protein
VLEQIGPNRAEHLPTNRVYFGIGLGERDDLERIGYDELELIGHDDVLERIGPNRSRHLAGWTVVIASSIQNQMIYWTLQLTSLSVLVLWMWEWVRQGRLSL